MLEFLPATGQLQLRGSMIGGGVHVSEFGPERDRHVAAVFAEISRREGK